jgi:hypothetical protein
MMMMMMVMMMVMMMMVPPALCVLADANPSMPHACQAGRLAVQGLLVAQKAVGQDDGGILWPHGGGGLRLLECQNLNTDYR